MSKKKSNLFLVCIIILKVFPLKFACNYIWCHFCPAAFLNKPGDVQTGQMFSITFFCSSHVKAVRGMARPEMDSRVDDCNPGAQNSCRMEVLRQDAWPNGSIVQPCHWHRTIATQTSTVSAPLPHVPTQDAFSSDSVLQQDCPLRDITGKALQHRDHACETMFMWCAWWKSLA